MINGLKNGSLYTKYAYDGDKNLTGLKTMLGQEVLADNRYSYDHNGNCTEKQQPGGITRYTYDSVNQLPPDKVSNLHGTALLRQGQESQPPYNGRDAGGIPL